MRRPPQEFTNGWGKTEQVGPVVRAYLAWRRSGLVTFILLSTTLILMNVLEDAPGIIAMIYGTKNEVASHDDLRQAMQLLLAYKGKSGQSQEVINSPNID